MSCKSTIERLNRSIYSDFNSRRSRLLNNQLHLSISRILKHQYKQHNQNQKYANSLQ